MNNLPYLVMITATVLAGAAPGQVQYQGRTYPLYPERLAVCPEIPSPVRLQEGTEVVIVLTVDGRYTLVPVTVENGSPLNYAQRPWGKGRQLEVDGADFPALAATGRHDEMELRQVTTITGKSVAELTEQGRPMVLSGAGFLAQDGVGRRQATYRLRYHGREISVQWEGSRGWQESLFADEIQGKACSRGLRPHL
jgi:hypothetical protein